jgi:hypothetical protein
LKIRDHQIYALNKLLKYQKSFLFWPRQTGKSFTISLFLDYFVNNNHNQNILFISNNKFYIKNDKDKIMRNIGNLILDKHRSEDINFINDNYLQFVSINQNYEYQLKELTPSLIIFDEFNIDKISSLEKIINYIAGKAEFSNLNINPKCIFTSTFIDMKVINLLDYNNDWYINIIPPSKDMNIEFDNYKDKVNELSKYKSDELLDYCELLYQRKRKIQKLNKISEE